MGEIVSKKLQLGSQHSQCLLLVSESLMNISVGGGDQDFMMLESELNYLKVVLRRRRVRWVHLWPDCTVTGVRFDTIAGLGTEGMVVNDLYYGTH